VDKHERRPLATHTGTGYGPPTESASHHLPLPPGSVQHWYDGPARCV